MLTSPPLNQELLICLSTLQRIKIAQADKVRLGGTGATSDSETLQLKRKWIKVGKHVTEKPSLSLDANVQANTW
jgi:hypothetical protein